MKYLFEVSWEVCNLVGGIHTVLRSKAPEAVKECGEQYFLIGPQIDSNTDFVETDEPDHSLIRSALDKKGISCRLGRWDIEGRPRVILVSFHNRYDAGKLLYDLWHIFGVDSMGSSWDYIEPVMFSTTAGEAIEAIFEAVEGDGVKAVAQFHEWMCGAGLLHLKKTTPEIGTVFTSHATILGRAMAGAGVDIYDDAAEVNPEAEARNYGILPKFSMEYVCAQEADVFTTVSEVTADEALKTLNKRPHYTVYNGVTSNVFGPFETVRAEAGHVREKMLDMAGKFLGWSLPASTKLWATSGRYEFHNKGFDLFLDSLARLDVHLRNEENAAPVVAWMLIATGHNGMREDVARRLKGEEKTTRGQSGVTTHNLHDEHNDAILQACQRLGLTNSPENKVHVIFSPVYVGANDGLFNLPYESVLSAFDLGVFPSYYEPWGYTPLECIALGVPTITSDLAGFGRWTQELKVETGHSIAIIERSGKTYDEAAAMLLAEMLFYFEADDKQMSNMRTHSRRIATMATWAGFFQLYRKAYERASQMADKRLNSLDTSAFSNDLFVSFQGAQGPGPHYSRLTVAPVLPAALAKLGPLAHNLWWAWHIDGLNLFREIDPALWDQLGANPVYFLEKVRYEMLEQKTRDPLYLKEYEKVTGAFDAYMADKGRVYPDSEEINPKTPVAYFSMEFCIHECLPIYSGGLGVLSGDHLKSASDLNLPLVAVGFLYKQGYFEQRIDLNGNQVEHYPEVDPSRIPVEPMRGKDNLDLKIEVELPGRIVAAKVWQVNVGRIKLYLLDTNLEENMPADRGISAQLYGGGKQMRIEQEIILGIGGVRLLEDRLNLKPSVYHLNEGHCGFLLFERIERFMKDGISFQKAREAVKASSVFTTHTPVPAGNETFDIKLMKQYFGSFAPRINIPFEQLMEMGMSKSGEEGAPFSMTVLGLKLTSHANGVSKLHGKVCQQMWRDVWKGVAVEEVPITSVTNGIHITSWIGPDIKRLLDQYLDIRWDYNQDDPLMWQGIDKVPSEMLWYEHQMQKNRLLESAKVKLYDDYIRRGENPTFINESLDALNPAALTIGFARRFATYKRANLLFNNRSALVNLLNDPDRPMQFLFAGKAHPADSHGKDLIKRIIHESRTDEFKGKIFYLENYNMWLGRLLTQGVDVWLNTPVRPHEASGTSGMKVVPNGGLNCSILDGWWDEAYKDNGDDVGFAIQSIATPINRGHQDEMDANAIYNLFLNEIIPLYFDRDKKGTPHKWVQRMKGAFKKCAPEFSTMRMVDEYFRRCYLPTAKRNVQLTKNNFAGITALTDWKRSIEARFSTVQIENVRIKGMDGNILQANRPLEIEMVVNPGKLKTSELLAELIIGPEDNESFAADPVTVAFERIESDNPSLFTYRLSHKLASSGTFKYTVRVVPNHPLLVCKQETGLVRWA